MDENTINQSIEVLKTGGTLIYPTETCYGLGCNAMNEKAVKKIYDIKKRSLEKKLTVVVANLDMAEQYCTLSPVEKHVCNTFMPGPLTLIVEKRDTVPDIVNDQFVFRVPDHPLPRRLSKEINKPIIATSANVSGNPSSYRIEDIDPDIRDSVDTIIDQGTLESQPPSTIIDLEDQHLTVHRKGPISKDEIQTVIERHN